MSDPTITLLQNDLMDIQRRVQAQGGSEADALRLMAQYAQVNGRTAGELAAASGFAEGGAWSPDRVTAALAQYAPGYNSYTAQTTYGLQPALNTLKQGADESTSRIGATQERVSGLFGQGLERLQPYMQTGLQANQLQAALSGTLGQDAQRQAYANFQASPGQEWLQQQGERAVTRNAAALGGLGGGNVMQELQRQGQGLAAQDFNNYFQRIGMVGDRGFAGATQAAGFGPQEASIQSGLGQFSANIPLQTAQSGAQMQFQAGRDISQNFGGVSSALSALLERQGAGTADAIRGQTQGVASLYERAANGDAQALQELGLQRANVNMQGANAFSGQPYSPMGNANYGQQVDSTLGGAAGFLQALGGQQQTPTGPTSAYNTQPGYGPSYNTQYQPYQPPSPYIQGAQFLGGL